VPSTGFKAKILNKVLFPIKTAKPLIPLSQQLSKQNTKGISEEHKKRPRKDAIHAEVEENST